MRYDSYDDEDRGGFGAIKQFPAKFPTVCATCGVRVPAGTAGRWETPDVSGKWKLIGHDGCSGKAGVPAEPKPKAKRGVVVEIPEGDVTPREPSAPRKKAPASIVATDESREATTRIFAGLDDHQKRIALWKPHMGNVRVLAAAGSGKTRTTTALVAKLVNEGTIPANRIIVTTFTKKAGLELISRLSPLLPPGALDDGGMRVGTFHSMAHRTIMAAGLGKRIPGGRNMDVAGSPIRSYNLWRQIVKEVWRSESEAGYVYATNRRSLGLDDDEKYPDPKSYGLAVDVARSAPGSDAEIRARLDLAEEAFPQITEAWDTFVEAKKNGTVWDFADTLAILDRGLSDGTIKDSADLVIVDEAQDNSEIQFSIARQLARGGNVILVGDVRQSIYAWRGAEPEIMATADKTIGATTMEIPTNYRSGKKIVALGNKVCEGETWNVGSPATPRDGAPEGVVTIHGGADEIAEAAYIAQEIAIGVNSAHGGDHGRFAVLTRTNAGGGTVEAALVERKIPCVVVGGTPFFKRDEAQGTIAWIKLAFGGFDVDAKEVEKAFKYPAGSGLGAAMAKKLADRIAQGEDFSNAADMLIGTTGPGKFREKVEAFAERAAQIARDVAEARDDHRWPGVIDAISGMLAEAATASRGPSAEDEDDKGGPGLTVLAIAKSFPSPEVFFQFVDRCVNEVVEAEEEKDADGKRIKDAWIIPPGRVIISTIHKAKGLEWPVVFVSATRGMFPHRRSGNVGEEKRLFYVAVTRAEEECRLTYAEDTGIKGTGGPSPFLALAEEFAK